VLSKGYEFTLHSVEADRTPTSRRVCVFYVRSTSRLGTLYWCDVGQPRQQMLARSLPLCALTDVYMGKHAGIADGLNEAIPSKHMFTLLTEQHTWHLEARHAVECNVWCAALKAMYSGIKQQHVSGRGAVATVPQTLQQPDRVVKDTDLLA